MCWRKDAWLNPESEMGFPRTKTESASLLNLSGKMVSHVSGRWIRLRKVVRAAIVQEQRGPLEYETHPYNAFGLPSPTV